MTPRSILVLLIGWLLVSMPAAAHEADLDRWFAQTLVPSIRERLATLPRFRDESIRFVVSRDESPQSEGSALAVGLRDRLRDALSDIPGIRVVWQADRPGVGLAARTGSIDCTRAEAGYFVAIEVTETSPRDADVTIRALDVRERRWVPGFSESWHGTLDARQRRDLHTLVSDPEFRGERGAPWNDDEADLIAANLAYELSCGILRQTAGEYIIAGPAAPGTADALLELVGNNLADLPFLQASADPSTANALIRGKAHPLGDGLYQYWVSITPKDPAGGLPTITADAYIRIADPSRARTFLPAETVELPGGESTFLTSLRIVRGGRAAACRPVRTGVAGRPAFAQYGAAGCYSLQVSSRQDAVVFFLNQQRNNGLVRLAAAGCDRQAAARIARAGQPAGFPLPADMLNSAAWTPAGEWSVDPDADTYIAIASSDTRAARALARHIEKLPVRCSSSVRPGLDGDGLRQWLVELQQIAGHWQSQFAWLGIRTREVY